jgi:hypothetical protein
MRLEGQYRASAVDSLAQAEGEVAHLHAGADGQAADSRAPEHASELTARPKRSNAQLGDGASAE